MSEPQSHKSFRPITTLSFRGNWVHAERQKKKSVNSYSAKPADEIGIFGLHIVNLILHTIVTALVAEAASFVFIGDDDASAPQNHLFSSHDLRADFWIAFGPCGSRDKHYESRRASHVTFLPTGLSHLRIESS
jgi:hypothetical protein